MYILLLSYVCFSGYILCYFRVFTDRILSRKMIPNSIICLCLMDWVDPIWVAVSQP